jgi:hypothetical protein
VDREVHHRDAELSGKSGSRCCFADAISLSNRLMGYGLCRNGIPRGSPTLAEPVCMMNGWPGSITIARGSDFMPGVIQVPREPLLLADFILGDQYLHFPLR